MTVRRPFGRPFGRALLALLVAIVAGALPGGVARAGAQAPVPGATVRLGVGSGTSFVAGEAVSVPIVVEFAAGAAFRLGSLSLRVTWDSTRLALEGVDAGSAGSVFVGAARAGERRLSFLDAAGMNATFTLATLRFRAVGGATGISGIGVGVLGAGNELGATVLSRVRVVAAYPVCASDGTGDMLGDVTGDGRLDVLDAQAIGRFAVGLPVADSARVHRLGDVTGDGVVDIVDAQQLARHAVGLPASARVGQATTGACVLLSYRVVLLSPSTQTIRVGARVEIRARVVDVTGTPVPGIGVTWEEPGAEPVVATTDAAGEVATRRTPQRVGSVSGVAYLGAPGDGAPRVAYEYVANTLGADLDPFVLELQWVGPVPDAVRAAGEAAKAALERVVRTPLVRAELTAFTQVTECEPWIRTAYTGTVRGVVLYLTVGEIDGPGGTIARAGPCMQHTVSRMPAFSTMEVDAEDWEQFDPPALRQLLLHEVMHAIGIGTTEGWGALVRDGATADPAFTGATAYLGWQSARGVPRYAGAVPVESEGGTGTAGAHWRTAILADELMVGFVSRASKLPLSLVTVGALRDLGYAVDLATAQAYTVPPAAAVLADPEPRVPIGEVLRRAAGELRDDGTVLIYRTGKVTSVRRRRIEPIP